MAKRLRTPADWPIIVLLLALPLTLYASAWPQITERALVLLLAGIVLFYATILWATSEQRLRLGATFLVAAGTALALIAPFGVTWISDAKGFVNFDQVYAVFPHILPDSIHPNVLAGALAALLPVTLALATGQGVTPKVAGQRPGRRLSWCLTGLTVLSLTIMAVVLILTKSRGAFFGAIVGLALVVAYRFVVSTMALAPAATRRWPLSTPWPWVGLALLALGGIVVGTALARPARVVQIVTVLAASPVVGGWPGRLELWSRALDAIADFPLTGIGLGTFQQVVPLRYPYVVLAGSETAISHAHNLFLQVAVDLGLPGLVAFIALLGVSLAVTVQTVRRYTARRRGDLALQTAGLGAGLVAVSVHGLIDAVSWNTKPAIFIWVIMGLIMAHAKTADLR